MNVLSLKYDLDDTLYTSYVVTHGCLVVKFRYGKQFFLRALFCLLVVFFLLSASFFSSVLPFCFLLPLLALFFFLSLASFFVVPLCC